MSQIYGTTKDSNTVTPVRLSPERQTGMTTGESATHMDTSSPDYTGTEKKTSLIGKVKAKAKKLKSKLKPGHHEGENPTSPGGTPTTHADDSSSPSSSDDDGETQGLAYTPLSKAVNLDDDKKSAAAPRDFNNTGNEPSKTGSDTDLGTGYGQEERKFGLLDMPDEKGRLATEDPSAPQTAPKQFKSPGPAGVEQAVPTEYNYYNSDPVSAMAPSPSPQYDDLQTRKEETPSALGGASAGIAPIISGSKAFGSGNSESEDESRDFSGHDSSVRPTPEDRDTKIPEGILKHASTETASRKSEDNPLDDVEDSSNTDPNQDVGMSATKKVTDTLTGAKDAAYEKLYGGAEEQKPPTFDSTSTDKESSATQKPIQQRAYEGLTGVAVGAGQTLGVYKGDDNVPSDNQTATPPTEPTIAQKAYDAVVGTENAASEKLSGSGANTLFSREGEPTGTQKAYESAVGTKDAVTDKGDQTQPTMTQKAYDTIVGAKDAAASKLGGTTTGKDSGTDGTSFFNSCAAPVDEYADRQTDSKPITQKAGETTSTWKDTVASKLGYGGSATHTPGEEMTQSATDSAVSAKNAGASKLEQADQALSSDSTPVSQKVADTTYEAKDTAVSAMTPNEHDKALSQTITESISNLPTLLSEKLGFGGNSATTSPKTSEGDFKGPSELDVPVSSGSSNLSTAADTPDSTAASPGIMNRVTGAVSSLLGGGAKKSTTGGHEYSPTVSPSDSGCREPMVTDTSGRYSSPAA